MTPAEAVATIPHRDLVVSTSALHLAVQVLCDNVAIGGQPEWEGMRKAWNLILEMQVAISAAAKAKMISSVVLMPLRMASPTARRSRLIRRSRRGRSPLRGSRATSSSGMALMARMRSTTTFTREYSIEIRPVTAPRTKDGATTCEMICDRWSMELSATDISAPEPGRTNGKTAVHHASPETAAQRA